MSTKYVPSSQGLIAESNVLKKQFRYKRDNFSDLFFKIFMFVAACDFTESGILIFAKTLVLSAFFGVLVTDINGSALENGGTKTEVSGSYTNDFNASDLSAALGNDFSFAYDAQDTLFDQLVPKTFEEASEYLKLENGAITRVEKEAWMGENMRPYWQQMYAYYKTQSFDEFTFSVDLKTNGSAFNIIHFTPALNKSIYESGFSFAVKNNDGNTHAMFLGTYDEAIQVLGGAWVGNNGTSARAEVEGLGSDFYNVKINFKGGTALVYINGIKVLEKVGLPQDSYYAAVSLGFANGSAFDNFSYSSLDSSDTFKPSEESGRYENSFNANSLKAAFNDDFCFVYDAQDSVGEKLIAKSFDEAKEYLKLQNGAVTRIEKENWMGDNFRPYWQQMYAYYKNQCFGNFTFSVDLKTCGGAFNILCGDVNPSGKLADTWASDFSEYPSSEGFNESDDYVNYTEDIYVGYRYFETVPGKKDKVNYPFGYGLSYTEFKIDGVNGFGDGEYITFAVTVTNVGKRAGKEVVQVYCEAPQGLLGKAKRSLIAFKKTKLLKPGESETLAMRVKTEELASYDDLGKIQQAAYVLEKGEYFFHVGTSVRDTVKTDYTYVLRDNVIVKQLETRCAPELLEKRMLSDGSYETLPSFPKISHMQENAPNKAEAPKETVMFEAVGDTVSLDEFMAQLTDDELIEQLGGHDAPSGMNCAGTMSGLERLKIPYVITADGPAGLRSNIEYGIFSTAWPCETVLASSWNTELVAEIGAAGALEIKENNIGIWLAPGMNIHRNPLCGRNFEYYSEDPLLTGKMGAAMVRGIQSQKISPAVKHLTCNNKEVNRSGCDSRVSERALREIYLKGFEICVTESDPWMIMTSYNIMNGRYTSENYELLTGILREEWGYGGMFTSDWANAANHVSEVLAGNDIKMYGQPQKIKEALQSGELKRVDIEVCVRHILKMVLNLD